MLIPISFDKKDTILTTQFAYRIKEIKKFYFRQGEQLD